MMFLDTLWTSGPGVSVANCHMSDLMDCGIGKELRTEFFKVRLCASLKHCEAALICEHRTG